MNSLRTLNVRRRNLLLLTICLPKLLTVVALRGGSAGEPTVSARHGAHRAQHVGNFLIQARQLTPQAKRRTRIIRL
jgi:hypothetical protein